MISQILSIYKADTSDVKAKLKELQGSQKMWAENELKLNEARNKSIEDWTNRLGKATVALGVVGAAGVAAFQGLKTFGERARLEMAAGAVNVDKLAKAFDGLVGHSELLQFAAQSQRGEIGKLKLSHSEMQGVLETVGKATTALTRAGFDQHEVMQKLSGSVIKLKDEGLDDLGLKFEQGSTRAETLKNMMAELNRVIEQNKGLTSTAADDIQRLSVAWDNAKESALAYIGATLSFEQGFMEGKGALFDAFNVLTLGRTAHILENRKTREANATAGLVDLSGVGSQMDEFGNWVGGSGSGNPLALIERLSSLQVDSFTKEAISKSADTFLTKMKEDYEKSKKKYEAEMSDEAKRDVAKIVADAKAGGDVVSQLAGLLTKATGKTITDVSDSYLKSATYHSDARPLAEQMLSDWGIDISRTSEETIDNSARLRTQARREGYLESMFGPIEQIDLYAQSFSALGTVFTAFGDAVGSAYEAIVTGQGSVGDAFKRMAADSMLAAGKASMIDAIRETALGFGMLAIGSPSAAAHFKSAAIHGSVAALAGIAARAMGTSAQVNAENKAAEEKAKEDERAKKEQEKRASRGGGGGGGDGSARPIYVILGENFGDSSPRMRRQRADEAVERALRERDE